MTQQITSFNGATWRKCYNPDITFAPESITNMCNKSIMVSIPHTKHRQICVSAYPVIVPQHIPFRRLCNFMKADWNVYSAELDNLIEDIEPIPANFKCFVECVRHYRWHPEDTYQEDVEQYTFPVLLISKEPI